MDRRALLKGMGMGCLALAARDVSPAGGAEGQDADLLAGVAIVDAHAHPDQFFGSHRSDRSSTLESITALGMAASSFSALGDSQPRRGGAWQAESMHDVRRQLDVVQGLAKAGKVRPIRSAAEIRGPVRGNTAGSNPGPGGCPSEEEIAAVFGGNVRRVFQQAVG